MAKALNSEGTKIQLESEIWYKSCNFYTPDVLVNKDLVIEVDGPYHEEPEIRKNDRIRKRELENFGYLEYRFGTKKLLTH